jgi:hypothetical protein
MISWLICNCGVFKIEENVIYKCKTCVWVDVYVGGNLRKVEVVSCAAISMFAGPSLLLHLWEQYFCCMHFSCFTLTVFQSE